VSTSRLLPHERTPRAELNSIVEKDIAEVACFIALQSGRSSESVESHLRWFLLENPARQPQDTLGYALRSGDRIVGCILCSPQLFRFGNDSILFMGSSSFYVDDQHRGHGGRIFLQYCRLGNQRPLFGTSANAEAAALWKAAGATPIPYSDVELFGVLRWPPVGEELAHRQNAGRVLTRLAGSSVSDLIGLIRPLKLNSETPASLQRLTSVEQVNGLPIHSPSTKLTAMRDVPYLLWRYFSRRDETTAVYAFRSRQPDREILVTVNQRPRGYRAQINTLNVLDVYPEVPPNEWLRIVAALTARYRKVVDAIVLRSQDAERQKLFCAKGFQRRTFDAPNGWFLDKAKILSTKDWYPVPADGDGLI
jgi:hypothetical protein